ncbi:MAG: hypothetical protein JNL53_00870 [Cyclobacteriaceae bacterium]|nr:hypothetical protein [Cyclobacteriaceae bacterium]
MNTVKIISGLFLAGLFSLTLTSCENNESIQPQQDLLPQKFSVDIPQSLSNTNSVRSGRASGRIKEDTLQGNDIYLHLNTFIAVGEGAAQLVEEFINGIRKYKIDRIQSLTYRSEDDNRIKNLVVLSDVDYEGRLWDYQLTITDAESETQPDGGKALQIFWNKGREISGIAIIKPYNCDRIQNVNAKDAVFRIDYTETSTLNYDAQMEVSISGLPLANPLQDPFSVSALKMFVGKKGDAVDVFGNTDHPNAILFAGNTGFNWAFVASGSDSKNIGVAEVGLPPSQLDETDRNVLLKEYSIRNVFTDEITAVWPGINQDLLAAYLSNTAAPGYFDAKKGFLTGGISPGAEWDELAPRLTGLTPFNPKVLHELAITFK